MYPRTNYEMSEEDLKVILEACKPVPAMMIGSYTSSSPQENANRAWKALGEKMDFDYMTVRPISGKGQRFFSAIPSETESQRIERTNREAEEKKLAEIASVKKEINKLKARLVELNTCKGIDLGDGNFSGCTGIGGDCPICGK